MNPFKYLSMVSCNLLNLEVIKKKIWQKYKFTLGHI
jgi:hypothetical protein